MMKLVNQAVRGVIVFVADALLRAVKIDGRSLNAKSKTPFPGEHLIGHKGPACANKYSSCLCSHRKKKGRSFCCIPIKGYKMEWQNAIAMIADDDDDLTYLLENILRNRQIKVLPVHSLHDALECLALSKPNLVFLDNSFPYGIGVNFIGNIKSTGRDIQIIMMSSDSSAIAKKKAMAEGAHYFLEKPFSKTTIDHLLDQVNSPTRTRC